MNRRVVGKRAKSGVIGRLLLVAVLLLVFAEQAEAQRPVRDAARRATATRAELEELAASAEQMATSRAVSEAVRRQKAQEAQTIRTRLTTGDFTAGDRISITILGAGEPYRDTLTVAPGGVIALPNIGQISLRGILRMELEPHLTREVSKFVRNVTVTAGPVTRIAVMGAVGRPGFFQLSSDAMLSTAIMIAGGPNSESDIRQIVIRRGDDELWDRKSVQVALQEGVTLQELGLRGGDEIHVGRVRRWGSQALTYMSLALQVASTVIFLTRSR
jgi:protein involved in polysaccharide export with SLBB domain